jgi:hypothetical protein
MIGSSEARSLLASLLRRLRPARAITVETGGD